LDFDLFEREQEIYDKASENFAEMRGGISLNPKEFGALTKEYGRLLKQLRRVTKISDRATVNLNASRIDLLDKVYYDTLTGIYNRRFMEENLMRIVKSLARSGAKLSVMMLDIDFFKNYNDTYGHSEGDVCLKAVAEIIKESLFRYDDFAARYGGEEFAVILPNTDESGARFLAEKILENIRARNIPHEKSGAAGCVTISIGVTTGDTERTQTGDDYIRQADKALYQSKQNGRNCYTYLSLIDGGMNELD
jgi:diguanylate cyclase (GGDEF)-like protein